MVVDNLSRRNIDTELGCDSLTPIQSPDVSLVCVSSFVVLWGVYILVGRLYFVGGVYYEYFYVSYVLVHTSYAL